MAKRSLTLVVLLAALGLVSCGNQPTREQAQEPGFGNTPVSAPAESTAPASAPTEGSETPAEGAASAPQ